MEEMDTYSGADAKVEAAPKRQLNLILTPHPYDYKAVYYFCHLHKITVDTPVPNMCNAPLL